MLRIGGGSRGVGDTAATRRRAVERGYGAAKLFFAQSLLEYLPSYMIQLEGWIHSVEPLTPADLKVEHRISDRLELALKSSYVDLDVQALEAAVVRLLEPASVPLHF